MGLTVVVVVGADAHENRIDALGPSAVDLCTAEDLEMTSMTMHCESCESLHTGVLAPYEEVTPLACLKGTLTNTRNMNCF